MAWETSHGSRILPSSRRQSTLDRLLDSRTMEALSMTPHDATPRPTNPLRGVAGDVAGLLYGAIVTAAAMAVVSAHEAAAGKVLLAVAITLVVYYCAHVFTRVEADRLDHPTASFTDDLREAERHELTVLIGGLPAVSAFVVSVYLGATASRAVDIALWVTIGLLGIFGYLVGRQSGATGWRLVVEIGGAALFGVAVAILKALLH